MDWDDDKQKQLMDFMAPQGMNPATQTMGIGAPPAGGSPPPPTVLPQEKPLTSMVDDDEGGYDKQEEDGGEKIVDSHPLAQLPGYIQNQEQQVDKWGPDKQAALMQHLQEGYKSPGNIIAKGGASLADAIMQGVARAGSGGNLAAINERENQNLNRAQDMGKSLQAQNLEALQKKQGLEGLSSSTPLGASQSGPAQFLAKQLWPNIPPEKLKEIGQNPQALAAILPPGVDLKKALAEIENTAAYRQAEIGMQKATLANTAEHEHAEEHLTQQGKDIEKEKATREALAETAKHPILHPVNAFKANQALANAGGIGDSQFSPDVMSYAQKHGISPEKAQEQKMRRSR